jgi:hypothetical protein
VVGSADNEEAVGKARKLLHYGQLPDKIFRGISSEIRKFFRGILKFLCIYMAISREIPKNV